MIGLWLYILIGTIYMLAEFKLFMGEDLEEDTPRTLKFLYFLQMTNHLLRTFAVWPTYALEDFILFICRFHDGDGDIDGPDDD